MSEHDKTLADLNDAGTILGTVHPEWKVLSSYPSGTDIRFEDDPNRAFRLLAVGKGIVEVQLFPDLSRSDRGKTLATISGSSPLELADRIDEVCQRALAPPPSE
jgi:hypothetical protein